MARSERNHAAPKDANNALEVEDLSVRFGETIVLDRLSFEVPRATSLAIIGPNGSGKTVLFQALIGALPYEGHVRWADGTRIGYVPQKLDIERDLPITGNDLLLAKTRVSGASPGEVAEALANVGFAEKLATLPIGALSGGQFQRLLVAVALVGRPTALLLDEPTAGVDEPGQETLNEMIGRLRDERGMTTLLISHDVSVVFRFASNVLCLGRGKSCFGPPKTVLTPERLEDVYGSPLGFHTHDDDDRP